MMKLDKWLVGMAVVMGTVAGMASVTGAIGMADELETEVLPYMPLKGDFGGTKVMDTGHFVPNIGDYTLQLSAGAGQTVGIAFGNVEHVMEEGGLLRVACSDGTAYIFENGKFKGKKAVDARYELSKDNIVRNGGFEEVEAVLAESRWQPAAWETWDGGRPTWGGETGKTNVREDAAYRSEGLKSLIMHSESRYLMQQLPAGALKPHTAYLLTYDYWTSEGTGNGNTTYRILFGSDRCGGDLIDLPGHTTPVAGRAKGSFALLIQTPEELPGDIWFSLYRSEAKVDWIDDIRLVEVKPGAEGIKGNVGDVAYLGGYAYAPDDMALPDGIRMEMTPCMVNAGFSDATFADNAPSGWQLSFPAQSKISTSGKGGGIIPEGQNHWQLWKGSGGMDGKAYQAVTGLPNGKYSVKAAVSSSFNGTVSLFANDGKAKVTSGEHRVYEVLGIVFNGTLELGIEVNAGGSPTIDMDDFTLTYCGSDREGYAVIMASMLKEAIADTVIMVSLSEDVPGFNNLGEYRKAIALAESFGGEASSDQLVLAIRGLDEAMKNYDGILAEYGRLKEVFTRLETAVEASGYADKSVFMETIAEAKVLYASKEDGRGDIEAMITKITGQEAVLEEHDGLKQAIEAAQAMMDETGYPGKPEFAEAIAAAQAAYDSPVGADMQAVLKELRLAQVRYYNSQYTRPAVAQTVSEVDYNLKNGVEKYVLRVDGRPFYMTNVQVRLDKLYGYEGWNDTELESVMEQAASDGFNTVSIPLFWREVEPEKNLLDWRILDKYMGWCKKYGLKMELLWFSWSSGGRVQYLWNCNGRKELRTPDYVCSLAGTSEFNMLKTDFEYSLDWRDKKLRDRERYVLSEIMEHVAVWDANNGMPHVVVGVQLGNEARAHGRNTATSAEIIDYYHHVGAAVKESKYSVWTRLNCVSYETSGRTSANEAKRNDGGTNIDFVGIDIYGTNASKVKGNMDGQLGTNGKNFRMIMEIDAKDSNSPIYQMAALAGDKSFDYYNYCVVDGNALYAADGHKLVERAHVREVRQRNKMLNLANQDIAVKAHGKGLYVYNYAGNSTVSENGLEGISFIPSAARVQAVAIRRSGDEILLLSTSKGTFVLPEALNVKDASFGHVGEEGGWVREHEAEIRDRTVTLSETACVRLELGEDVAEDNPYVVNPEFNNGYMTDGAPYGWVNTTDAATSKISVAAKGDGTVIKGDENHWQLWHGGGLDGKVMQVVKGLPEGRYRLSAGLVCYFSGGSIRLFAGDAEVSVRSGISAFYEVEAEVSGDGSLPIGLDIKTDGGQTTIEFDHVKLVPVGSGIFGLPVSGAAPQDFEVYTLQGISVKSGNGMPEEAVEGLPCGVYIVKGKASNTKIMFRE